MLCWKWKVFIVVSTRWTLKKEKYVCGFDVTAKFKRSDFDMNFALPAIGDQMVLFFGVETVRNKD